MKSSADDSYKHVHYDLGHIQKITYVTVGRATLKMLRQKAKRNL